MSASGAFLSSKGHRRRACPAAIDPEPPSPHRSKLSGAPLALRTSVESAQRHAPNRLGGQTRQKAVRALVGLCHDACAENSGSAPTKRLAAAAVSSAVTLVCLGFVLGRFAGEMTWRRQRYKAQLQ